MKPSDVELVSPDAELKREFVDDVETFGGKFDEIAKNMYEGIQLDRISQEILHKHQAYLASLPFSETLVRGRLPEEKTKLFSSDTIEEDLALLSSPTSPPSNKQYRQVLSNFWMRACKGRYLRITFNKSRLNLDEDRTDAVLMARKAIRYDVNNFQTVYWYMLAVGWEIDHCSGKREKVQLSSMFKAATLRCIQLKPKDALAHNLLGRYHFEIAQLNWLERTFANKFLGCQLNSTLDDAEREIRLAHELNDNWLPSGLWMARVLMAKKAPMAEVCSWIDLGLKLASEDPTTDMERIELLELRDRLDKLSTLG